MRIKWKTLVLIATIALSTAGLALNSWTRGQVVGVLKQFSQSTALGETARPDKSWLSSSATKANTPWDRTITLSAEQIKALGLQTVVAQKQTEPWPLRLTGMTDYDPATVTMVRTQFDSRVDKVLVDQGTPVKIGDPLLELFSTDLAEAKSNYEKAVSQWTRDKRVLDYKTPLAQDNILARKELIEVENDEGKSRLDMKLAKDKLLVYGLSEKEIEAAKTEDGVQKARMTLRSRAGGVVVERNVVRGNNYTSADLLMRIAPLDHLWVRGSVSELDAEKVEVGQNLKVVFPFSDRTIDANVDYIDKAVDSLSRSAKFRSTITNPGGRLKAGMFVRVWVELPPKPGRTVVPRVSMVSVDRSDYVFVKKPDKTNQFERRPVFVAIEKNDIVIIAEPSEDHLGLAPGEQVVTTGSLILEQMYEDAVMGEGGLLVSGPREGSRDPINRIMHVLARLPSARS